LQSVSPVLLVVDDDPDVRRLLHRQLAAEGYRVELAADGAAALARLASGDIDLVVLDRGLPDADGLAVCRSVRASERHAGVAIIMLTAAISEAERLAGFEAGVDDYLTKPFSLGELVARITAVLRRMRSMPAAAALIAVDERLQLDLSEQAVIVAGQRLQLRPTEARLLALLVEHAGHTVSFPDILARVWGPEYRDETHYVHLYVTYLRQKIEPDPSQPRYILSRRGQDYHFCPLPEQGAWPAGPPPRVGELTAAP
jgi:two-component system, OmpR family, KDP operon response regulator KdpE